MPDNTARRCAPRPHATRGRIRRRSMRRGRFRGPASGSAKRCRQKGCRSAFPRRAVLQGRRYGNWLNRRHRPAPCRARSSAATAGRPVPSRGRARRTKALRLQSLASRDLPSAPIHLCSGVLYPEISDRAEVTSFRGGLIRRHNAQSTPAGFGTKLRSSGAGLPCRDLGCAANENRHRLVLMI
jgi:hypothetical protein